MKIHPLIQKCISIVMLIILGTGQGCKKDKSDKIESKIKPHDFLSNDNYDQLIVEIQYVNGHQPTSATVDNLTAFLQQRLNKSAGITVVQNGIGSPGKSAFSLEDIQAIEKNNRSQKTHDKTLTAYFFFADGDYADNNGNFKVLGVAYGNSSMVIFEKTIQEFSGGIGKPSATTLESTVVLHEFGHILGLTNNGSNMQTAHQDEANGKHCNQQNCLMYFAVENSNFVSNLMGGTIPQLDAQCLSDLKANGGK